MRTPEDIVNRKEANYRYYQLKENQEQKRAYQFKYDRCLKGPDKLASPIILEMHEEWAIKNGYRNEDLHAINTKGFKDDEK